MNEHEKSIVTAFFDPHERGWVKRQIEEGNMDWLDHCSLFDPHYTHWISKTAHVEKLHDKLTKSKQQIYNYPPGRDVLSSAIIMLLKGQGCPQKVYIMSSVPEINCLNLALEEALKETVRYSCGTIISCIPGRLAYYRDELGSNKAFLIRPGSP